MLALPLALCAAGVGLAFALAAQRDYGAGLLARPARQAVRVGIAARPVLAGLAAAVGALAGWAAGYAVLFAVCGAAAKGIGQLVGSSGALTKEFTRIGGQAAIVNAYLAALMLLGGPRGGRLRGVRGAPAARRGDRRAAPTRCSPASVGRVALGAEPPGGRLRRHGVAARGRRQSRPASATACAAGRRRRRDRQDAGRGPGPAPGGGGDRRRVAMACSACCRRRAWRSSWTAVGLAVAAEHLRPGAPALPLGARHLAVHARARAARRHGRPPSPLLWLRRARAGPRRGRPGGPAPPRHRQRVIRLSRSPSLPVSGSVAGGAKIPSSARRERYVETRTSPVRR